MILGISEWVLLKVEFKESFVPQTSWGFLMGLVVGRTKDVAFSCTTDRQQHWQQHCIFFTGFRSADDNVKRSSDWLTLKVFCGIPSQNEKFLTLMLYVFSSYWSDVSTRSGWILSVWHVGLVNVSNVTYPVWWISSDTASFLKGQNEPVGRSFNQSFPLVKVIHFGISKRSIISRWFLWWWISFYLLLR